MLTKSQVNAACGHNFEFKRSSGSDPNYIEISCLQDNDIYLSPRTIDDEEKYTVPDPDLHMPMAPISPKLCTYVMFLGWGGPNS